ncbi:hypothetical protein AWC00_13980 [Mycobacterium conspicuum]|nr:hypothetical protein AWC00_13980 [Mycobacterium conspicuum]
MAAGANLIVSLVTLFASSIFSTSDTRLVRKIERDSAILKELPETAKPVMEDLIRYEVQQHSDRRKQRAVRHINPVAVAGMIIIAGITFALGWGLAYLAVKHGWFWWIPFGALTGFGLLLMASGGRTVVYYGDEAPGRPSKQRQPSPPANSGE